MSHGPGKVERAIADLFRSEQSKEQVFTVTDLCRHVFGGKRFRAPRAQRVSVLRAAHGALRRADALYERRIALEREADKAACAKHGQPPERFDPEYSRRVSEFRKSHPSWQRAQRITGAQTELSNWRATEMADRTVVFHHYRRPVRVWAVNITPAGIVWAETEIVKVTDTRVSVVYKGVRAPLDRFRLCRRVAWWRGVRFVSERSGWSASWFEQLRHEWFAHHPDFVAAPMPFAEARRILGLKIENYTRDDVIAAFRKAAKRCHPDLGGTAEKFRELVKARDHLLASIGTSAPAPKEPSFRPLGVRIVYRRVTVGRQHLAGHGNAKRLGTA